MTSSNDPYCYPGTTVLRNHAGLRNQHELDLLERDVVFIRGLTLARHSLPGAYDLAHLQAFHRVLFADVYPWAGQIRTVNIAKDGTLFGPHEHVAAFTSELLQRLNSERHLTGLTAKAFTARCAYYLGELNAAHPFREGNGRTQRAFLGQLAHDAGYRLDWATITPERNIRASKDAMRGDYTALRGILQEITQPVPSNDDPERSLLELRRACFPKQTPRPAGRLHPTRSRQGHPPRQAREDLDSPER